MARQPSPTDFVIDVPDVGSFTFARRRMADEVKIQVEYARMIEGVEPTEWLRLVATWLSALKVLTVRAPEDFRVDELDPLDDETYVKLSRIYSLLSEKELSFRRKP